MMKKNIRIWKLSPEDIGNPKPIHLNPEPDSLDAGSRLLPQGGYTTFRTYQKKYAILINDHFRRLEETSALAGKPQKLDSNYIRPALRSVIGEYPSKETRVRIMMDLEMVPGTLYFLIEELTTPNADAYQNGVKVVTRKMQRQNPKAKLTNFIFEASKIRQALSTEINEALMISKEGKVLEGLSSNFFGIADGVIQTSNEGILYGITRSMVIEVIQKLGFPLRYEAVSSDEIRNLDECFLTSASRSVLPVTQIDKIIVGTGTPGKLTLAICEEYKRLLESYLEPI
jgi:branched-chain amino acid aminotransferase